MESTSPPPELRRCSACGQPTLACVRDWQHVVFGVPTPSRTLELACQRCGFRVTLEPRARIRAARILAWLLLPTIFGSIYFFARARRLERAWTDHPIVAAAEAPRPLAAARVCRCGRPAPCVRLRQRRIQGRSVGTRATHVCKGCGASFEVGDGRHVAFLATGALLLSVLGVLFVVHPPGSGVGAEATSRLIGFGLLAFAAATWVLLGASVQARIRHPSV